MQGRGLLPGEVPDGGRHDLPAAPGRAIWSTTWRSRPVAVRQGGRMGGFDSAGRHGWWTHRTAAGHEHLDLQRLRQSADGQHRRADSTGRLGFLTAGPASCGHRPPGYRATHCWPMARLSSVGSLRYAASRHHRPPARWLYALRQLAVVAWFGTSPGTGTAASFSNRPDHHRCPPAAVLLVVTEVVRSR